MRSKVTNVKQDLKSSSTRWSRLLDVAGSCDGSDDSDEDDNEAFMSTHHDELALVGFERIEKRPLYYI
jgi:hypothetical protein